MGGAYSIGVLNIQQREVEDEAGRVTSPSTNFSAFRMRRDILANSDIGFVFLNKDEAGRRITDPVAGPLFSGEKADGDTESGTIYVLRSKSDHPVVTANRDLVHKIGVTNMPVEQRIAGARLQSTYLLADVEVVATYKLFNMNRTKLEHVLHRALSPARLDLTVP